MTTLGKAYVQIMPSAKGISGSIQDVINPEATSAGKSAGSNIASAMADSLEKAGKNLTKYITAPAIAAATAVSGVVGALGFSRLVGMDNAQAKLKGLGVEGKQLEQVMNDARNAVTGTTHTMADAANVAAGALAAGVKEGADLERYIKLVGDAATGANAPMGEMSQIFNRIQGTGKLMGTELEMIEYRLPGFSQALAKHLGVAPEEMRKMVSEGKVSVDDFLAVMEGYAGGMSAAYAETWSGLKDNVLANIGIIGEALLEGLFEDGKKGMAEFLDYLRNSEGLKEWARDTGETLRNVFATIVDMVKNVINWWTNLDGSTQKMILTLTGIAIAIGPVLLAVSKMVGVLSPLFGIIGSIGKGLTAMKGGFIAAKAGGVVASGAMAKLGGVMATLLGPVGLVIGAIVGLIALFTVLYQKNEGFRELVNTVWETIKETISTVIQAVSDFVMEIFGGLVEWWNENNELIREAIQVVWQTIQQIIMGVIGFLVPYLQTAWTVVQTVITTVWNVIKTVIQTVINVIMGIIKAVMQAITGDWSGAWQSILGVVSTILNGIRNIISSVLSGVFSIIGNILGNIRSRFSSIFNGLRSIVSSAFNRVRDAVRTGIDKALEIVTNIKDKFFEAGENIVQSIADGIKGAVGKVTGAIGDIASKVRNFLPFSPAKEGPLKDLDKLDFGGTISLGINDGADEVQKAMEKMLAVPFNPTVFNANGINSEVNSYSAQKNQPIILQVDGKTFAQIIGDYTSQEGGNRIRRIERGLA